MNYPTAHTDKSSPYYANATIKGVPYFNGQTRGILGLLIGQGGDCGLDSSVCLDALLELGLVERAIPWAGVVYRITQKGRDYFADVWPRDLVAKTTRRCLAAEDIRNMG